MEEDYSLRGVNQAPHLRCEQDENLENVCRKEENPFWYTQVHSVYQE